MTGTGVFADFHKALHTFGILFHCCSCSPPVLGTIHKGRPADPVEGGGLLLFVNKFYTPLCQSSGQIDPGKYPEQKTPKMADPARKWSPAEKQ